VRFPKALRRRSDRCQRQRDNPGILFACDRRGFHQGQRCCCRPPEGHHTVAIQGNNFFYSVLGTTLMPPGVVVTFAAPAGNTFTNPGAAVCNWNPGAVTSPVVLGTNVFTCTAPAGGPYSQVFLTNPGPTAAIQLAGADVATLGTNRYPG